MERIQKNNQNITIREQTEKGDITRSLEELIKVHFVSKKFKDIIGSTRLTRREVLILSVMEINRIVSKILSITENDISHKSLEHMQEDERIVIKELYYMKLRFMNNPLALSYAVHDSFMQMYGLSLQSLDGLSREEGITLAGGVHQRIIDPDDLGRFDKIKRRLFGNVLFTE